MAIQYPHLLTRKWLQACMRCTKSAIIITTTSADHLRLQDRRKVAATAERERGRETHHT